MRYLLIILGLFAFIFSNEYSFSDVNKQLEFERQRIYINQVDEKEIYISGRSDTKLESLFYRGFFVL